MDFNPRSHKGSDAIAYTAGAGIRIISIHAPTRGATIAASTSLDTDGISIHAPTRGATVIDPARTPRAYKISIHAPTRGATSANPYLSRLHGISIHAPTRGATNEHTGVPGHLGISIHAPTRGATVHLETDRGQIIFQSTLPQGERRRDGIIRRGHGISIHAPTRGATPGFCQYLRHSGDFNPRSHKGSDLCLIS